MFTSKRLFLTLATALVMLLSGQSAMAQYVPLTALNGTSGTGGEGYPKLVDAKSATKWGQGYDVRNGDVAWIIIKAESPVVPTNYFLQIANDTGSNTGRNWQDWTIYAANFASDGEAVRESEAWTVVDERVGYILPTSNFSLWDMEFNKADGTTAYQYYMIEITNSVATEGTYLQMSEWGLGTADDFNAFLNQESSVNEPITYTVIAGDRHNNDGESASKLVDGNNFTKWGTGINEGNTNGNYVIINASRTVAPTYYKLVTGTDNASFPNRNWKNWEIYGTKETESSKITRDSEGWVLLDKRTDIGKDILPDNNSYEVYFEFNQGDIEKYRNFKIEVRDIFSGSGFQQMSEFALGDAASFEVDKKTYLNYLTTIAPEKPYNASLVAKVQELAATIQGATQPAQLGESYNKANEIKGEIANSVAAYEKYQEVINTVTAHFNNHECITGEGRTIIDKYLNQEIAPNAEFANGSYLYIMKNLQLDNDQINEEGLFANSLLEKYASDLTDSPVPDDLIYTLIAGTENTSNPAENPDCLFDGDTGTKWCTVGERPVYVIFSTSEAIAPTYIKLTTANDSQNNGGARNWKKWKIYGANFATSEEATNRDAAEWVLIDEKSGLTTANIPAANYADAYLNFSKPSDTKFEYFRIEVEEFFAVDNGMDRQQMSEIRFGNNANRILERNAAYEEFAAYDLDVKCQKALIEEYKEKLQDLQYCADIATQRSYTDALLAQQTKIDECVLAYEEYEDAFSAMDESYFEGYGQATTWAQGYVGTNEGPNNMYINGTHDYIMENLLLSTSQIKAETEYINAMMSAADMGTMICLGGHTGISWGDHENWTKLIDNNLETKWGGAIDANGGNWVIFRSLGAINPYFYTLNTGNDTQSNPGRNWKNWQIYGANFAGDGEATVDAEGWVLIDDKQNIGQDRLHPTNHTASYFGFSSETTEPYMYYKVVVTGAYSGDAVQMQELIFGTEEEFTEIKDSYTLAANEYPYGDKIAEQKLLDNYEALVETIQDVVNMEVLFRINYGLETLRDSIDDCAEVYGRYIEKVAAEQEYLAEQGLTESEALTTYTTYLEGDAEPSDIYPNGEAQYIIDNHLLADSVVVAEMDFLESLKRGAVAAGYKAGTDISVLILNPEFRQGGENWSQDVYGHQVNEENTMGAAEMTESHSVFDLNQTLTGLKNGYYLVKLNAAFRPNNKDIYSYNHHAIAYANEMSTMVPNVIEGMIPVDEAVNRENCWLEPGGLEDRPIEVKDGDVVTDTLGYVVWGIQSCCYAFNAGRYEIALVAKVTDGNLTIGVKNDGTPAGGDWCGVSNFRLTYLGEEATEEALTEAATYNAARIDAMTNPETGYVPMDTEDVNYKNAPNFAAAQKDALLASVGKAEYAALVEAGKVFEATNETKHAYITLNDAKNNVYNKWGAEVLIEDLTALEDDIYAVMDNLNLGMYADAEAALDAKEALYVKYPDYLVFDMAKTQINMEYTNADAFTYDVVTSGANPTIALSGFYENIDSTRVILAIDYKSEVALNDGRFYFATPNLDPNQSKGAGDLEATADWKTIYWDITEAVSEWNFGAKDSWIRWELTSENLEATGISVRNARVITREEMEAVGGTINAIESVEGTAAPKVKGIYTLTGVRVQKAQKGLYIIDGKKVLLK